MAYKKEGNLSIVIGEYTDGSGNKKTNRKTIGSRWKNEEGKIFYRIDSSCLSMQLFALANKDRKPDVMVSFFEEKNENQTSAVKNETIDDEIPF